VITQHHSFLGCVTEQHCNLLVSTASVTDKWSMEHWGNDSDRKNPNYLRQTCPSATFPPYIPHGLAWNMIILDEERTQKALEQNHRIKRNKLWLQTEIYLEYILGYCNTMCLKLTSILFLHHY
jgi:hypothetical protein